MIYAVAHTKGGVGKSLLTAHLATWLLRQGSVLVINADPQQSITTWLAWRHQHGGLAVPDTRRLEDRAVYDQGQPLAADYTHTVIDAGGRDNVGLRAALALADRLIIPTSGDATDMVELGEYLDSVVAGARALKPALDYRVLGNRIDTASRDGAELLADLDEAGIPHFRQLIGERRAYARAWRQGLTAAEYRPRNAAATHELGKLLEEIDAWVSPPVPTSTAI